MFNHFLARNLPPILWFDAATCLGFGLVCTAFAKPISALTLVPIPWLQGGGIICLLASALILFAVTRRAISPVLVMAIVGINLLWAIASVLSVVLGWIEPNLLGKVAVVAQGIAVFVIAEAQFFGLRARESLHAA